ncbi:autotransporter strand-loop-strand O-heptosyltransferase [Selenomonas ruminantium]|uniref:autotransporter strand-loop-strand O-heptosyltransferase n=1 Tax=Selenomonas ruminantium TaxID=971 RepID=UPI000B111EB0|nr:autotransporter strand-loop-strand O-heptosyltransferase [Selenomonas ruminantium]
MKPIVVFSAAQNEMTAYQQALLIKLNKLAGEVKGDTGITGLKLDFNFGLRLEVPDGDFFIRIRDGESGQEYFAGKLAAQCLISMEKYYIPWQVEVMKDGELVFVHQLDVTGQLVYMHLGNALGDMLAIMPYVLAFQKRYNCRIVCQWQENFSSLLGKCFPQLTMVKDFPVDCYAAFVLGIFQDTPILSPVDARLIPLPQMGSIILHMPIIPPKLRLVDRNAVTADKFPYVCIATQATGIKKCWHYPHGWEILTAKLQESGYRVLCIDGNQELREGRYVAGIPQGAEDFTGYRPLIERLELLAGAACFIGVSSGLSWLAYAAGTPVVLISGFTLPSNEFFTPYRVINYQVCHGCHNDLRVSDKNSLCPYHQGTERELECSREITVEQVWKQVQRCLQE